MFFLPELQLLLRIFPVRVSHLDRVFSLAQELKLEPERIFKLLIEREKESSTVLTPFLAIPHIIIEGQDIFGVLIARCSQGIAFSDEAPRVHTVFVLIGSKDKRPLHLTSLAAIAQIVQEEDFEKRWMVAKKPEALRDLVLLGKRKRH